MTVSSTTNTNSYTTVNATTHSFAYGFKIFADGDLEVIVRSAAGTETVKTLDTHYVVTNAGIDAGGNVLFKFNTGTSSDAHFSSTDQRPASGETVLLRRNLTLTQGTDYIENDTFSSNSHENALDRLTFITQALQEESDRSFKVSKTNTITSSEFADSAATRASKTLGFDSDGNLTTIADFLPIGGDAAQFTYSTTTTDADPGSGFIRFNNTTLSSASIAYVDDNEINGTDVSAWVQSFDDVVGNLTNRGRIRISKANTLDTWAVFKVSGAVTDASGYNKLALTYIDTAGTFANNDKVFLSFVASGEDGAIPGYLYKFATSTTDGDPGAGILRFNHATYANVTEIYIDDADFNGGATQADTETWGSSTSTIKGFLHIVDINDSTTYARFKITAAVDDETGYNKITVVHLASNNTFSADDELSVHFTRTGLKGDTGSTGSTGATGATGDVSLAGTQTLTNKTLTAPKINENVAVTSTATELNLLNGVSGLVQADFTKLAAIDASATELNQLDGTVAKTAGKESIWVPAGAMYPSTTNPCSDLTQVETTALRPDLKVLDFAAAADDFAQFSIAFPKSWNHSVAVTFQVFWTPSNTNTDDCIWSLQGVSVIDNGTIDVAFGTAVAVTDAGIGAIEDQQVSAVSGDLTIASAAVDAQTYFQIFRDANAGGDTFSGVARLLGVKIFFTTNAANDA